MVLHFNEPAAVSILGTLTRRVARLGLRLDDRETFVQTLAPPSAAGAHRQQ